MSQPSPSSENSQGELSLENFDSVDFLAERENLQEGRRKQQHLNNKSQKVQKDDLEETNGKLLQSNIQEEPVQILNTQKPQFSLDELPQLQSSIQEEPVQVLNIQKPQASVNLAEIKKPDDPTTHLLSFSFDQLTVPKPSLPVRSNLLSAADKTTLNGPISLGSEDTPKDADSSETLFYLSKTEFLENARALFSSSPNGIPALDITFNKLMDVFKKTPAGFVDSKEKPEVTKDLSLKDFLKAYFRLKLNDVIADYNKRLTAACARSNESEFKLVFDSWLGWTKYVELDVAGITTHPWISLETFLEALKWCAKRNPTIKSAQLEFFQDLEQLVKAGKITLALPADHTMLTPTFVGDVVIELESKGYTENANALKENYSNILGNNKAKSLEFDKIKGSIEAKKVVMDVANECFSRGINEDNKKRLIENLNSAKKFDEILQTFVLFLNSGDFRKKYYCEKYFFREFNLIFSKYYAAKGEPKTVIDSFLTLYNLSSSTVKWRLNFNAVEAWANIILNLKDITELTNYLKFNKIEDFSHNSFSVIDTPVSENFHIGFDIMRNSARKDMEKITMSSSIFEFFDNISNMSYKLKHKEIHPFLECLSILFCKVYKNVNDNYKFLMVIPSDYIEDDLFEITMNIFGRKLAKPPKKPFDIGALEQISYCLKHISYISWSSIREGFNGEKSVFEYKELEKLNDFIFEAEVILFLNIPNDSSNKQLFSSYKNLRKSSNDSDLAVF